jgi:ribulose-5-phosphate 4-epimerase/fuculose-1-phosphate aldolase
MSGSSSEVEPSADVIDDLVVANHIASDQGLVDGFGHLSARHDKNPDRYLLAHAVSPALVTAADIKEFTLDSDAVDGTRDGLYVERYIHGEIYKARPDVMAIVHSHSLSLVLFSVIGEPLKPVFHMSAFLHTGAPVFEIRESGGMTDMLIRTPELGVALAETLDDKRIVLMRGHGATIVGPTMRQTIFRSVFAMHNADVQERAKKYGGAKFMEPEEAEITFRSLKAFNRAWDYWKELAERRR